MNSTLMMTTTTCMSPPHAHCVYEGTRPIVQGKPKATEPEQRNSPVVGRNGPPLPVPPPPRVLTRSRPVQAELGAGLLKRGEHGGLPACCRRSPPRCRATSTPSASKPSCSSATRSPGVRCRHRRPHRRPGAACGLRRLHRPRRLAARLPRTRP